MNSVNFNSGAKPLDDGINVISVAFKPYQVDFEGKVSVTATDHLKLLKGGYG
jgi:hypothetical protein